MNNKAFSLIELSIVLIIIGLLVAGITGGASLIESAKIRGFANEVNSYKQGYNAFIALKGRIPGDANNTGMIGNFSNQTYNSNSFPPPYNSNSNDFGIPNSISAPFVDLYLAKIIDFKPKNTNLSGYSKFPDPAKPESKYIEATYYFEYGKEASNNESVVGHCKKGIKAGNKITLNSIKYIVKPEYFKKYDKKFDDGYYNNGNIRGACHNGKTSYDDAILKKQKCSYVITALE